MPGKHSVPMPQTQKKSPSPVSSGRESQKKVRDQAVAWDPISQKMMNNTQLYVRYKEMSDKLKMEEPGAQV